MVVIESGTALQVLIGTVLSGAFLLFQVQAAPFRSLSDDFLASTTSFSLQTMFLCCIAFKYAALTDEPDIRDKMNEEQTESFSWRSIR